MKSFYEFYQDSILNENNQDFIVALTKKCKKFDFKTEKFNAVITDKDLYDMFDVLNKYAFNNMLVRKVKIRAVKFDLNNKTNGVSWKGRHGIATMKSRDEDGFLRATVIDIAVRNKDNPFMILCVLCHEMIHELDSLIGPSLIETLPNIDGTPTNYNSHGSFFIKHMNRINKFLGLNIMISYDETNKERLKEINDSVNIAKSELKKLAKKTYSYIKTDGYKEIEWLKDGFIFWQE